MRKIQLVAFGLAFLISASCHRAPVTLTADQMKTYTEWRKSRGQSTTGTWTGDGPNGEFLRFISGRLVEAKLSREDYEDFENSIRQELSNSR